MGKLAAVGWIVAIAIGGISFMGYQWMLEERQAVLAKQAADYQAKLAKLKAEHQAAMDKVVQESTATQEAMKVELDFEKMPALPLTFAFRKGQVLYVESLSDQTFECKVRLLRPSNSATVVKDFTINARAYKDMAAMDQWVFRKGDEIEFTKPGFKPWKGVVP